MVQLKPNASNSGADSPAGLAGSQQRWQHIQQVVSPADSTGYYNDAPLPVDSNAQYTASQLADQHNVVQCPDCTKPVLESALAQHAVNCQRIRDRAQQQMGEGGRKRRMSDATVDDSTNPQQQKKAKSLSLVLTLGDGGKGQASPSGSQPPKLVLKDSSGKVASDKPHRPRGPVDLDRHCGVINDKGLPCSRSLTCKTHAMGAKRSVPHRSRPYDDLLADWQRAKAASNAAAGKSSINRPESELDGDGDSPLPTGTGQLVASAGGVVKEKKRKKKRDGATVGGDSALSYSLSASNGGGLGGKERRTRAGGEGGKKGLLIVGEWGDEPAGTGGEMEDDDLIDSEEEVEAVLKGLSRVGADGTRNTMGRPLAMCSAGGAGFAAASFFVGRNHRLARLRDTLGGIFATRG